MAGARDLDIDPATQEASLSEAGSSAQLRKVAATETRDTAAELRENRENSYTFGESILEQLATLRSMTQKTAVQASLAGNGAADPGAEVVLRELFDAGARKRKGGREYFSPSERSVLRTLLIENNPDSVDEALLKKLADCTEGLAPDTTRRLLREIGKLVQGTHATVNYGDRTVNDVLGCIEEAVERVEQAEEIEIAGEDTSALTTALSAALLEQSDTVIAEDQLHAIFEKMAGTGYVQYPDMLQMARFVSDMLRAEGYDIERESLAELLHALGRTAEMQSPDPARTEMLITGYLMEQNAHTIETENLFVALSQAMHSSLHGEAPDLAVSFSRAESLSYAVASEAELQTLWNRFGQWQAILEHEGNPQLLSVLQSEIRSDIIADNAAIIETLEEPGCIEQTIESSTVVARETIDERAALEQQQLEQRIKSLALAHAADQFCTGEISELSAADLEQHMIDSISRLPALQLKGVQPSTLRELHETHYRETMRREVLRLEHELYQTVMSCAQLNAEQNKINADFSQVAREDIAAIQKEFSLTHPAVIEKTEHMYTRQFAALRQQILNERFSKVAEQIEATFDVHPGSHSVTPERSAALRDAIQPVIEDHPELSHALRTYVSSRFDEHAENRRQAKQFIESVDQHLTKEPETAGVDLLFRLSVMNQEQIAMVRSVTGEEEFDDMCRVLGGYVPERYREGIHLLLTGDTVDSQAYFLERALQAENESERMLATTILLQHSQSPSLDAFLSKCAASGTLSEIEDQIAGASPDGSLQKSIEAAVAAERIPASVAGTYLRIKSPEERVAAVQQAIERGNIQEVLPFVQGLYGAPASVDAELEAATGASIDGLLCEAVLAGNCTELQLKMVRAIRAQDRVGVQAIQVLEAVESGGNTKAVLQHLARMEDEERNAILSALESIKGEAQSFEELLEQAVAQASCTPDEALHISALLQRDSVAVQALALHTALTGGEHVGAILAQTGEQYASMPADQRSEAIAELRDGFRQVTGIELGMAIKEAVAQKHVSEIEVILFHERVGPNRIQNIRAVQLHDALTSYNKLGTGAAVTQVLDYLQSVSPAERSALYAAHTEVFDSPVEDIVRKEFFGFDQAILLDAVAAQNTAELLAVRFRRALAGPEQGGRNLDLLELRDVCKHLEVDEIEALLKKYSREDFSHSARTVDSFLQALIKSDERFFTEQESGKQRLQLIESVLKGKEVTDDQLQTQLALEIAENSEEIGRFQGSNRRMGGSSYLYAGQLGGYNALLKEQYAPLLIADPALHAHVDRFKETARARGEARGVLASMRWCAIEYGLADARGDASGKAHWQKLLSETRQENAEFFEQHPAILEEIQTKTSRWQELGRDRWSRAESLADQVYNHLGTFSDDLDGIVSVFEENYNLRLLIVDAYREKHGENFYQTFRERTKDATWSTSAKDLAWDRLNSIFNDNDPALDGAAQLSHCMNRCGTWEEEVYAVYERDSGESLAQFQYRVERIEAEFEQRYARQWGESRIEGVYRQEFSDTDLQLLNAYRSGRRGNIESVRMKTLLDGWFISDRAIADQFESMSKEGRLQYEEVNRSRILDDFNRSQWFVTTTMQNRMDAIASNDPVQIAATRLKDALDGGSRWSGVDRAVVRQILEGRTTISALELEKVVMNSEVDSARDRARVIATLREMPASVVIAEDDVRRYLRLASVGDCDRALLDLNMVQFDRDEMGAAFEKLAGGKNPEEYLETRLQILKNAGRRRPNGNAEHTSTHDDLTFVRQLWQEGHLAPSHEVQFCLREENFQTAAAIIAVECRTAEGKAALEKAYRVEFGRSLEEGIEWFADAGDVRDLKAAMLGRPETAEEHYQVFKYRYDAESDVTWAQAGVDYVFVENDDTLDGIWQEVEATKKQLDRLRDTGTDAARIESLEAEMIRLCERGTDSISLYRGSKEYAAEVVTGVVTTGAVIGVSVATAGSGTVVIIIAVGATSATAGLGTRYAMKGSDLTAGEAGYTITLAGVDGLTMGATSKIGQLAARPFLLADGSLQIGKKIIPAATLNSLRSQALRGTVEGGVQGAMAGSTINGGMVILSGGDLDQAAMAALSGGIYEGGLGMAMGGAMPVGFHYGGKAWSATGGRAVNAGKRAVNETVDAVKLRFDSEPASRQSEIAVQQRVATAEGELRAARDADPMQQINVEELSTGPDAANVESTTRSSEDDAIDRLSISAEEEVARLDRDDGEVREVSDPDADSTDAGGGETKRTPDSEEEPSYEPDLWRLGKDDGEGGLALETEKKTQTKLTETDNSDIDNSPNEYVHQQALAALNGGLYEGGLGMARSGARRVDFYYGGKTRSASVGRTVNAGKPAFSATVDAVRLRYDMDLVARPSKIAGQQKVPAPAGERRAARDADPMQQIKVEESSTGRDAAQVESTTRSSEDDAIDRLFNPTEEEVIRLDKNHAEQKQGREQAEITSQSEDDAIDRLFNPTKEEVARLDRDGGEPREISDPDTGDTDAGGGETKRKPESEEEHSYESDLWHPGKDDGEGGLALETEKKTQTRTDETESSDTDSSPMETPTEQELDDLMDRLLHGDTADVPPVRVEPESGQTEPARKQAPKTVSPEPETEAPGSAPAGEPAPDSVSARPEPARTSTPARPVTPPRPEARPARSAQAMANSQNSTQLSPETQPARHPQPQPQPDAVHPRVTTATKTRTRTDIDPWLNGGKERKDDPYRDPPEDVQEYWHRLQREQPAEADDIVAKRYRKKRGIDEKLVSKRLRSGELENDYSGVGLGEIEYEEDRGDG